MPPKSMLAVLSCTLLVVTFAMVAVPAQEAKQLFFCNLTESDLRSDSPVV